MRMLRSGMPVDERKAKLCDKWNCDVRGKEAEVREVHRVKTAKTQRCTARNKMHALKFRLDSVTCNIRDTVKVEEDFYS